MKLTAFSKVLITLIVVGAVGAGVYLNRDKLMPGAKKVDSNVPPTAQLPDQPAQPTGDKPAPPAPKPMMAEPKPGCADKPEVRFYVWAWNAQMGMMYATGGKQAAEGSLMCKHGVNLKLIREDNTDNMQSLLLAFAEELKKGDKNPAKGAHYVGIMGDGSAQFLKGLNDRLAKLGPEYQVAVVGSAGYSRGEDKLMGPPAWRDNPQNARGGLVAGVLRDGDWNIAMKWLGDNRIPNNPDDTTYDPDALNWVNASDYIDAAQKYVSNFCVELKHKKTGTKEKHCVDGVVTWTPGDVTVADNKGGLVSIVSTKEYRSQMPHVVIGSKKWMAANRDLVKGMLAAVFEGGDAVKTDDKALDRAADISALVYNEKDGAYWKKYFTVQLDKDKQGLNVTLGGSAVNNLADNLQLFGLAPGSTNLFAATYTVFANIVKSQYPDLMPTYYSVADILDTSYVKELNVAAPAPTAPDLPKFAPTAKVEKVVSRKSWDIQFQTGSAQFTPQALEQLKQLLSDLVIAGGTLVEIHGHTDNQGNMDRNMKLSEDRAFAVKKWLEQQSPSNFPEGRVKVFAHGQTQPLESNSTADGRAKNRRVEIVLGTSTATN
ncbi:MAG TPA: OmpA family protein [Haliangiales bacterium]|nr:OmpA family protein [Haliangiales bacterium]